jgi:hypothetical protein
MKLNFVAIVDFRWARKNQKGEVEGHFRDEQRESRAVYGGRRGK